MGNKIRCEKDQFRSKIKDEWNLLWKERFDDKVKGESISIRDYPLLLIDRGFVISGSRIKKTPNFSEIVEFWQSNGCVYAPNPRVGGWGKFIRTELKKGVSYRKPDFRIQFNRKKQQNEEWRQRLAQ